MKEAIIYTLGSVTIISLISFVGVLALAINVKKLNKIILYLVSFAAGALLGDVFIHLIPELIEDNNFTLQTSFLALGGIVLFFTLEKIIHWQHCHMPQTKKHIHPFAVNNLIGDGVHNFLDGLIIGASYLVNIPLGIATTVAVIFHEIPQEIGDFGVLLHGGFKKRRAIFLNFLTGVTAVLGAVVALVISAYLDTSINILASFAAGGFIYIAGSDLIPELHKKFSAKNSIIEVLTILLGMAVMYGLLFLE